MLLHDAGIAAHHSGAGRRIIAGETSDMHVTASVVVPIRGDIMSDKLRKVDYFHVMIPNKAGQASKVAGGLAAEGVNLLAFSGFPSGGETQLDLMPEDSGKLKRAAKKL